MEPVDQVFSSPAHLGEEVPILKGATCLQIHVSSESEGGEAIGTLHSHPVGKWDHARPAH